MKNILIRLLLFLVALPVLVLFVLYDPFDNHLPFNLLVIVAAGVAAVEMSGIFLHHGTRLNPHLCFVLGASPPLLVFLELQGFFGPRISQFLFAVTVCFLLAFRIFSRKDDEIKSILPKVSSYLFILVYPGSFTSFAVRLSMLPQSTIVLLAFLCAVYLNDSTAWAAGNLWGRNSRNVLAISPNKSVAGFAAGFLASLLVVFFFSRLAPSAFPASAAGRAALGVLIGITAIVGDLVESAFKRSAIVKDSGSIIPGRGGLLDSIDSPLFSAPLFYFLYSLLMGYL